MNTIIHPEALLYHHFLGPRIPPPDESVGAIPLEEDDTWVNNDVEAGEE